MNFSSIKDTIKKYFTVDDLIVALLFITSVVTLFLLLTSGADGGGATLAMAAAVVTGTAGGKHVTGAPLTTSLSREASPELLRNEIDERVTRIRPSATPIDQISRCAGARNAGAMVVEYYSVDTMPASTSLAAAVATSSKTIQNGMAVYTINTLNNDIFQPSETILVPGVNGFNSAGASAGALMLYVVGVNDDTTLKVIAVNGSVVAGNATMRLCPELSKGEKLVRMGRAATELDVQTPQFNALPVKSNNNCQIFKAQVEESTFQKIANKEVGWNFNDQEEVAVMDMRMGMEKTFLFGSKGVVYDPVKREEVRFTDGIWGQAGDEFHYDANTPGSEFIVKLTRKAFTGNAGSPRKILIGGSGLIEKLNMLECQKVIAAGDTFTHWGIDFKELHSKFGTLYVVHSETFDSCNHENDGMVIDPEYLTKYSHIPFRTERLDLKKSGQRNTDAVVITEASCLVLRYPDAHLRIVCDPIDDEE